MTENRLRSRTLRSMRDPARIPELCELLQRAWQRAPDLRLGQLVVNAVKPKTPCLGVFSAEDDAMQRGLEALAQRGVDPPPLPAVGQTPLDWEAVAEPEPTTLTFDGIRLASFDAGPWFCEVLELRVGGEYRDGSKGNPDAEAMAVHVTTALARNEPDVILLDLSGLRYHWGNGILRVFEAIGRFGGAVAVEAVVRGGPDSAPALGTLGLVVHTDEAAALEEAKSKALRRSMEIG